MTLNYMPTISLPLRNDMKTASLDGHKVCTSRTKRYGKEGDTFLVALDDRSQLFKITTVLRLTLGYVARVLYKEEGFATSEAFQRTWAELHPQAGFRPEQVVYTHCYTPVRNNP